MNNIREFEDVTLQNMDEIEDLELFQIREIILVNKLKFRNFYSFEDDKLSKLVL